MLLKSYCQMILRIFMLMRFHFLRYLSQYIHLGQYFSKFCEMCAFLFFTFFQDIFLID